MKVPELITKVFVFNVSPSEVRKNVEAGLLSDATVMRITYSADSTEDADDVAGLWRARP